jgi:hypothetical protein
MKSHWEHVNEHIKNLMGLHGNTLKPTKKIQYAHSPTLHNRKKNWAPQVHAASPHWLQSLLLS